MRFERNLARIWLAGQPGWRPVVSAHHRGHQPVHAPARVEQRLAAAPGGPPRCRRSGSCGRSGRSCRRAGSAGRRARRAARARRSSQRQSSPANLSSASRSAKRVRQLDLVGAQDVHAEALAARRARRGSARRARSRPAATAGARCRRRPRWRPARTAARPARRAVITATPEARCAIASRNSSSQFGSGPLLEARLARRCRTSVCMWSSAGSVSGVVDALVGAAALLAREAGGARSGGRAGTGRRAARAGPSASRRRPGVAPERGARLVGRRQRAGSSSSGAAAGRRLGVGHRRERGAAPEHEALGERVRGQPVGAVQPGAGALAHRVAGRAATSARRGRWPRRPSCSGPRGPPGPGRGAGRCPPPRARRRCWGSAPGRPSACRGRPRRCRCARSSAWMASATWSRGASSSTKRSPSASSSVAPSPRTASVIRKPSRAPPVTQRGGVELHELEVGQRGARGVAPAAARRRPPRAGWWCAPRARPCRRWRARPRARAPAAGRRRRGRATSPTQRPSCVSQRGGGARLEHLDALVRGGQRGQLAGDAPAGGRAARVHDAPARVAALQAEREVAVAVGVEAARRAAPGRARGRATPRTAPARRSARAASRPAASVSVGVQLGRVVVGQRGGDAALRPEATPSAPAASGSRAPPGRPRRPR